MNSPKRKRSRLACKPCRERKRKCDGSDPCTTCTQWGYQCYYATPRLQSTLDPPVRPVPAPNVVESDHGGLVRRLEANSGAAFVRKLGLKIDPTEAPKLNLFGWNIGTRQLSAQLNGDAALSIVEITSLEQMKSLSQVYFEKVDPCYGFIDHHQFFEQLDARWRSPLKPSIYDSILGGVAAIGCLFSLQNATITELHLVRSARSSLENYHLFRSPSIDLLTGWMLRTIYLRMIDSPHSTWLASSTLMHLVEASGLHPESPSDLLPSAQCDPDLKTRLVGLAHHLNAWTSFDLGLSRVSFQNNDLPLLPSSKPGDFTPEILSLLPVSVSLDPGRSTDETDLTSILSRVLDGSHSQPPSILAQCNLVLCMFRRIHTQNFDISSGLLGERVLALLKKGLSCARTMVMECSPWHQVANVPFHIICVLLVMDTRSSLALLPEAMQTLNMVASTYDTDTMRQAYSAACLLVRLHQQRRKDDISTFGDALNVHQQERQLAPPPQFNSSSEDYSWLGALSADLPGLQVDLDQFLDSDVINAFPLPGVSG